MNTPNPAPQVSDPQPSASNLEPSPTTGPASIQAGLGESFDLEAVYDAEIYPLMAKIIAICQRENMPMLATFCYRKTQDGADLCTSSIPCGSRQPNELRAALKMIQNGYVALAFTSKP